ncbi:acyl carrier protein [Jutongia sp. SJQ-6]
MGNQNLEVKEVCEELKEIIIDSLELTKAKEEIDGSDLMNELNINSIDALEILVRIENTYDIIIPDEDLSAKLFESLEGLANYVIGRCKA